MTGFSLVADDCLLAAISIKPWRSAARLAGRRSWVVVFIGEASWCDFIGSRLYRLSADGFPRQSSPPFCPYITVVSLGLFSPLSVGWTCVGQPFRQIDGGVRPQILAISPALAFIGWDA
jgi:hypothetical protein